MNKEVRSVFYKCRNKAKQMITKAMHEKARKKVQKIEEIRMEVKKTHIYYGARTKVICKKCKKV